MTEPRIAVLSARVADQIAAGEVVERPASVVKELVENSIDAGATRVDVELEEGGTVAIRVRDDGRGIHPHDLELALRRHATSKLARAEQLLDVATLGFRGEALASIAAVARVRIRSRRGDAELGTSLWSVPGEPQELAPVGMPVGTQVDVEHLFAAVPARRKFLRAEATEVGHCCEAVLRAALVHPAVRFSLRHGARELLDFPASDERERVARVLERQAPGPWFEISGERRGTRVRAFFGPPAQATRQRSGVYLVVRRRVVGERSLSQIVTRAYGDALPAGAHPVVCLMVEPPAGSVDVNVHPQKAEVRFSAPQEVYSAVRELLEEGRAAAPWAIDGSGHAQTATPTGERVREGERAEATRMALESWSRAEPSAGAVEPGRESRGYRLPTRALAGDYGEHKRAVGREVERLDAGRRAAPWPETRGGGEAARDAPVGGAELEADAEADAEANSKAHAAAGPAAIAGAATEPTGPQLLACLSGPTAIFVMGDRIVAADLRRLRTHLLRRRLRRELGSEAEGRRIPAQALLEPVVLPLDGEEGRILLRGSEALAELGLVVEPFGEGSLVVRALPAQLRNCVEGADVRDLLARMVPWLRLRESGSGASGIEAAVDAMAATSGSDPAPRFARRWIAELLADGTPLAAIPGVRVWSPAQLSGGGAEEE